MRRPFRRYQAQAFSFALHNGLNACALFMEMRLGKTLTAIRILDYKNFWPALVVCPYSAMVGWGRELDMECKHYIGLTGTKHQRQALMQHPADVYLINKEGFLVVPEIAYKLPVQAVILDESTFIKNPTPKVTRYFLKYFRNVNYRMILTGTPAPESSLNYITQLLFLMDKGLLPVNNYWEFQHRYCAQYEYEWKVKREGHKILDFALQRVAFAMTRKKAGYEVPEVTEQRNILYPPAFYKEYRKIDKEFTTSLDSENPDTVFATERWVWLRRLCGGFSPSGEVMEFPQKLEELLSLVKGELKGQQIIIFAEYVAEVLAITKALKAEYIYGAIAPGKRAQVLERFNKGTVQHLVIQPTTMRYGADLSVSSTCIFYSLPVSKETWAQCKSRLVRLTKKETILYINLIVERTIEEKIYESLDKNMDLLSLLRGQKNVLA